MEEHNAALVAIIFTQGQSKVRAGEKVFENTGEP